MNRSVFTSILLLALLVLASLISTGCGSLEDSDTASSKNNSARPWNSPAKWETGGLPSTMTEGR